MKKEEGTHLTTNVRSGAPMLIVEASVWVWVLVALLVGLLVGVALVGWLV